jgi:putative transferase (TIGR04331 family)
MVFLKHFKKRKNLLIRAYAQHYGWKTYERISAEFDDCLFDDCSQPFDKRLADSQICIFDHAHTTWLESLAANKPTVVFISDRINCFHPDAQTYIDMLKRVNILHYSPESAASHLNSIADSINEWWFSSDVQMARKEFVQHYAMGCKDWNDQWIEEFDTVLNGC